MPNVATTLALAGFEHSWDSSAFWRKSVGIGTRGPLLPIMPHGGSGSRLFSQTNGRTPQLAQESGLLTPSCFLTSKHLCVIGLWPWLFSMLEMALPCMHCHITGFWSLLRWHREASLNELAKVHYLPASSAFAFMLLQGSECLDTSWSSLYWHPKDRHSSQKILSKCPLDSQHEHLLRQQLLMGSAVLDMF